MFTPDQGLRGLILDVYRSRGADCSRGGVTATHDMLTLVGTVEGQRIIPAPARSQIFPVRDEAPAVVMRRIGDSAHLVPVIDGEVIDSMAGGAFASTSDSRLADFFRQLGVRPFYGAISVHDRVED